MSELITEPEPVKGELLLPAAVEREREAIDETVDRVARAVEHAESIAVSTDLELESAATVLRGLTKQKRDAEASRKFIVQPLNEHVTNVNAEFKKTTEPLTAAIDVLRGKITAFEEQREREQRERQAELDRQQRERDEKAAAERAAAEQEAREKREAAEKAAREAEAAAEQPAATDVLAEAAEKAQRELDAAKAREQTLADSPAVERRSAPIAPAPKKVEGITKRKVWKITSVDLAKLPVEYLLPDNAALSLAMRNAISEDRQTCDLDIPGVTVERVSQVAVGS